MTSVVFDRGRLEALLCESRTLLSQEQVLGVVREYRENGYARVLKDYYEHIGEGNVSFYQEQVLWWLAYKNSQGMEEQPLFDVPTVHQ